MIYLILLVIAAASVLFYRQIKRKKFNIAAAQFARRHGRVPLDYSEILLMEYRPALAIFLREHKKDYEFIHGLSLAHQYGWTLIYCYLSDLLVNNIIENYIDLPEMSADEQKNHRETLIARLNSNDHTQAEYQDLMIALKQLIILGEDKIAAEQLGEYFEQQGQFKKALIWYCVAGETSDKALYKMHQLCEAHPLQAITDQDIHTLVLNLFLQRFQYYHPYVENWRSLFTDQDSVHQLLSESTEV